MVSDGVEITRVHALDQSFQVLAHTKRRPVAALQEGPGAATVFRRCRASPADTDRIGPPRLLVEPAFDPDLVLPPVAEVILVEEPFVGAELEVDEPNLACILGEPKTAVPADPIISAVDAEAMQVRVAPAEDGG